MIAHTLRTGLVLLALIHGRSLYAHHGAAAYAVDSTVTISGVVESFDWRNPHALIRLRVAEGDASQLWTAETAGLVILARAGWSRDALVPGTACTLVGHAARNGSPTMILRHVVLADGRTLTNYVP